MHSKNILAGFLMVMLIAACTPVQVIPTSTPASIANSPTPAVIPDTPTPAVTAANTPLATPPNMAVVSSPALIHIDFLDANNGWGVAGNDSGYILRTLDGGTTWLNATPVGLTGIGLSTTLSVLDVNTAWVLVPNADFFTGALYKTSDGGLTWISFSVPFGGGSVEFLDSNTGRVMADRGAGAGSQSVEMFQTSDGGATWLACSIMTQPDRIRPTACPWVELKTA